MAKWLVLFLGLLAGCGPSVRVSEAGAPPCDPPPEPPEGAVSATSPDGGAVRMAWVDMIGQPSINRPASGPHTLDCIPVDPSAPFPFVSLTLQAPFEHYPEGSVLATGTEILAVTSAESPFGRVVTDSIPAALTVSAWPRAEISGVICLPDHAIRFNRVRLNMPRR
jgi:hypothetical protein